MSSSVIGALRATLGIDTAQYTDGLKKAKGQATDFGKVAKAGFAAAAAAAAAVTAALVVMTRQGMQAIDAQAKLARSVGGTVGALRGLERAASRAGIEKGALSGALDQLNVRLGQAIQQGKETEGVFERLGLSARDLSQMDVDERMAAIADAMRRAGMSTQEMSAAIRDLGIRGRGMVNLFVDGGDAIRESTEFIRGFGLALSDIDASKVERANDAMADIGLIAEGLRAQLAVQLAPILEHISELITDMAVEFGGFEEAVRRGVDHAATALGVVADILHQGRIDFAKLEFAGRGAFAGIVVAANHAARGIATMLDVMTRRIRNLLELISLIPGVDLRLPTARDSEAVRGLSATADAAWSEAGAAWERLQAVRGEEAPSARIAGALEEIRQRAEEAGDAVSRVFNEGEGPETTGAGAGGGSGGRTVRGAREAAAAMSELAREAARVFDETRTPQERFEARMQRLNEMLQTGAIDWDTYSRAVQQAQDELERFSEQGVDAFRGVGDEFGNLVARVVDGSTKMRDALGNLLSGAGGRLISGAVSNIIPGFANGTRFAPGGLAVVGERGPELVNLPRGAQVMPNARSGGAGINVSNTYNFASGVDASALRREAERIKQDTIQAVVAARRETKTFLS